MYETSALTGENVENAFYKIVQTILNKIDSGKIEDNDYSIKNQVKSMTNSRSNKLKATPAEESVSIC